MLLLVYQLGYGEGNKMKYIEQNDYSMVNTCIVFGDFDGVHLGHRAVIDKAIGLSNQDMKSVAVCFERDEELLQGKKVLTTKLEKKKLLEQNGPDVMISYRIDRQNEDMDLEDFIKDVLVEDLGAKVIVTGKEDKNIDKLREYSKEHGYELIECDTVCINNEPVTTEKILNELSDGELTKAIDMLGHHYLIIGEVMHGKALGRTVGMPTANIGFASFKQLPKFGVYGTISEIDGRDVKGLTNIGKRPSVDNFDYATIEAFLLDFSGDLYGKVITLEVHVFIRGVKKFNSLDEVKAQVNKDIESIRTYLDNI